MANLSLAIITFSHIFVDARFNLYIFLPNYKSPKFVHLFDPSLLFVFRYFNNCTNYFILATRFSVSQQTKTNQIFSNEGTKFRWKNTNKMRSTHTKWRLFAAREIKIKKNNKWTKKLKLYFDIWNKPKQISPVKCMSCIKE